MTSEITQLEQLEQLLIERRQYFIALNENVAKHYDNLDFFLTNENLLAHYNQLIDIVRQAITISEQISPEHEEAFFILI